MRILRINWLAVERSRSRRLTNRVTLSIQAALGAGLAVGNDDDGACGGNTDEQTPYK